MTALFLLFYSGDVKDSGDEEEYVHDISGKYGVHSSVFSKSFEDFHKSKVDESDEDIDSKLESETAFSFIGGNGQTKED